MDVTRPTAQAAIDTLEARGDLVQATGRQRGRIYEAPRNFDAVYGSIEPVQTHGDRQLPFTVPRLRRRNSAHDR